MFLVIPATVMQKMDHPLSEVGKMCLIWWLCSSFRASDLAPKRGDDTY